MEKAVQYGKKVETVLVDAQADRLRRVDGRRRCCGLFGVAPEAVKGKVTINEIASRYQVQSNQAKSWKRKLIEE